MLLRFLGGGGVWFACRFGRCEYRCEQGWPRPGQPGQPDPHQTHHQTTTHSLHSRPRVSSEKQGVCHVCHSRGTLAGFLVRYRWQRRFSCSVTRHVVEYRCGAAPPTKTALLPSSGYSVRPGQRQPYRHGRELFAEGMLRCAGCCSERGSRN